MVQPCQSHAVTLAVQSEVNPASEAIHPRVRQAEETLFHDPCRRQQASI